MAQDGLDDSFLNSLPRTQNGDFDYDAMTEEQLTAIADGKSPSDENSSTKGLGIAERSRLRRQAETGRDVSNWENFGGKMASVLVGDIDKVKYEDRDKALLSLADGSAFDSGVEKYGRVLDEKLVGFKAGDETWQGVFMDRIGTELAQDAEALPIVGGVVRGARKLGRNIVNTSACDVLVDAAKDAGFSRDEIEYALERAQGNPARLQNILGDAAHSQLTQQGKLKNAAKKTLKANPEDMIDKIVQGVIDNVPYTAQFILGGAAAAGMKGGMIAKALVANALPAVNSANSRFSELTSQDYSANADGNLVLGSEADDDSTAAGKAVKGGVLEAAVESGTDAAVGLVFKGGGAVFARTALGKTIKNLSAKARKKILTSDLGHAVADYAKEYSRLAKVTKVHSMPVEVLEEDIQSLIDDVCGLGLKDSEDRGFARNLQEARTNGILNAQGQWDTFFGLLGTMGLQGGSALARVQHALSNQRRDFDEVMRSVGASQEVLDSASRETKNLFREFITAEEPERDEAGNVVYMTVKDKDGRDVPMLRTDADGNVVTDADGNPVYVAKKTNRYRVTEEGLSKFFEDRKDELSERAKNGVSSMLKDLLRNDNFEKWNAQVDENAPGVFQVPTDENGVTWDADGKILEDRNTGIRIEKVAGEGENTLYNVYDGKGRFSVASGTEDAYRKANLLTKLNVRNEQLRPVKMQLLQQMHEGIGRNIPVVAFNTMDEAVDHFKETQGYDISQADNFNWLNHAFVRTDADGVKKAFFVLDNIDSPIQMRRKMSHEIGVHIGIDRALKGEMREKFMREAFASQFKAFDEDMKKSGLDENGMKLAKRRFMNSLEEQIAAYSEGHRSDNGLMGKAVSMVRGFGRRMGFDLDYTDDEISQMLGDWLNEVDSAESVSDGSVQDVTNGGEYDEVSPSYEDASPVQTVESEPDEVPSTTEDNSESQAEESSTQEVQNADYRGHEDEGNDGPGAVMDGDGHDEDSEEAIARDEEQRSDEADEKEREESQAEDDARKELFIKKETDDIASEDEAEARDEEQRTDEEDQNARDESMAESDAENPEIDYANTTPDKVIEATSDLPAVKRDAVRTSVFSNGSDVSRNLSDPIIASLNKSGKKYKDLKNAIQSAKNKIGRNRPGQYAWLSPADIKRIEDAVAQAEKDAENLLEQERRERGNNSSVSKLSYESFLDDTQDEFTYNILTNKNRKYIFHLPSGFSKYWAAYDGWRKRKSKNGVKAPRMSQFGIDDVLADWIDGLFTDMPNRSANNLFTFLFGPGAQKNEGGSNDGNANEIADDFWLQNALADGGLEAVAENIANAYRKYEAWRLKKRSDIAADNEKEKVANADMEAEEQDLYLRYEDLSKMEAEDSGWFGRVKGGVEIANGMRFLPLTKKSLTSAFPGDLVYFGDLEMRLVSFDPESGTLVADTGDAFADGEKHVFRFTNEGIEEVRDADEGGAGEGGSVRSGAQEGVGDGEQGRAGEVQKAEGESEREDRTVERRLTEWLDIDGVSAVPKTVRIKKGARAGQDAVTYTFSDADRSHYALIKEKLESALGHEVKPYYGRFSVWDNEAAYLLGDAERASPAKKTSEERRAEKEERNREIFEGLSAGLTEDGVADEFADISFSDVTATFSSEQDENLRRMYDAGSHLADLFFGPNVNGRTFRQFWDFANRIVGKSDPEKAKRAQRYYLSWFNSAACTVPAHIREFVDDTVKSANAFRELYPAATSSEKDSVAKRVASVSQEHLIPEVKAVVTEKDFNGGLDEEQRRGVNLIMNAVSQKNGHFMLADGTGFGKTRQIIATAASYRKANPDAKILIVTMNDTIIEDSFAKDSAVMGVDLGLFDVGTYNGLAAGKFGGEYDLALFDEAHSLKNMGSQRYQAYERTKIAHKVFVTATPMDRLTDAAYFFSDINNVSPDDMAKRFGFHIEEKEDAKGRKYFVAVANEGMNAGLMQRAVLAERDRAIALGRMIRRAYPFLGEIHDGYVVNRMSEEHALNEEAVSDFFMNEVSRLRHSTEVYLNATRKEYKKKDVKPETWEWAVGVKKREINTEKTNALDAMNESEKAADAAKLAADILAKDPGARVIVCGSQIGPRKIRAGFADSDDERQMQLHGYESTIEKSKKKKVDVKKFIVPPSLKRVDGLLAENGITDVAHIYSGYDKSYEQSRFVLGQRRVLVMTGRSGGTGINLDDVTGNHPTHLIVLAKDYSANNVDQLLGRVSRKTTKSLSHVYFLANGSMADEHRDRVTDQKMATLAAIQGGADLDASHGMSSEDKEYDETSFSSVVPGKEMLTKRAEDGVKAFSDIMTGKSAKSLMLSYDMRYASSVKSGEDWRRVALDALDPNGRIGKRLRRWESGSDEEKRTASSISSSARDMVRRLKDLETMTDDKLVTEFENRSAEYDRSVEKFEKSFLPSERNAIIEAFVKVEPTGLSGLRSDISMEEVAVFMLHGEKTEKAIRRNLLNVYADNLKNRYLEAIGRGKSDESPVFETRANGQMDMFGTTSLADDMQSRYGGKSNSYGTLSDGQMTLFSAVMFSSPYLAYTSGGIWAKLPRLKKFENYQMEDLDRAYREGDADALLEMLSRSIGVIKKIVSRYIKPFAYGREVDAAQGEVLADITMRIAQRYNEGRGWDPARGAEFSTWAGNIAKGVGKQALEKRVQTQRKAGLLGPAAEGQSYDGDDEDGADFFENVPYEEDPVEAKRREVREHVEDMPDSEERDLLRAFIRKNGNIHAAARSVGMSEARVKLVFPSAIRMLRAQMFGMTPFVNLAGLARGTLIDKEVGASRYDAAQTPQDVMRIMSSDRRKVVDAYLAGKSYDEIGKELGISPKSARAAIANANVEMAKVGHRLARNVLLPTSRFDKYGQIKARNWTEMMDALTPAQRKAAKDYVEGRPVNEMTLSRIRDVAKATGVPMPSPKTADGMRQVDLLSEESIRDAEVANRAANEEDAIGRFGRQTRAKKAVSRVPVQQESLFGGDALGGVASADETQKPLFGGDMKPIQAPPKKKYPRRVKDKDGQMTLFSSVMTPDIIRPRGNEDYRDVLARVKRIYPEGVARSGRLASEIIGRGHAGQTDRTSAQNFVTAIDPGAWHGRLTTDQVYAQMFVGNGWRVKGSEAGRGHYTHVLIPVRRNAGFSQVDNVKAAVLELIQRNDVVSWGPAVTLKAVGVYDGRIYLYANIGKFRQVDDLFAFDGKSESRIYRDNGFLGGVSEAYDDTGPKDTFVKKVGNRTVTVFSGGSFAHDSSTYFPLNPMVMDSALVDYDRTRGVLPVSKGVYTQDTLFSSVTPEEDRAYMDAVKHGDMETAGRMVREAAAKAMPYTKVVDADGLPKVVYHSVGSSYVKEGLADFTVFDGSIARDGFMFRGSKSWTDTDGWGARNNGGKGKSFSVFLNITNPLVVDAGGASYSNVPNPVYDVYGPEYTRMLLDENSRMVEETRKLMDGNPSSADKSRWSSLLHSWEYYTRDGGRKIKVDGLVHAMRELWQNSEGTQYDGVVVRNVDEYEKDGVGDDFIVENPSSIKSADPVTYDDSGNVIPLSKRFNEDSGDIRFSVPNVYTGSAADYDKSSLHYVGTGEGSQVYGWGLYGSNQRGVAEMYAQKISGARTGKYIVNGRDVTDYSSSIGIGQARPNKTGLSRPERIAVEYLQDHPRKEDAIEWLNRRVKQFEDRNAGWMADDFRRAAEIIRTGKVSYMHPGNIYDQTFFTNRPEGDESHMIKWLEKVGDENARRVVDQIRKEGMFLKIVERVGGKTRMIISDGDTSSLSSLLDTAANDYEYVEGGKTISRDISIEDFAEMTGERLYQTITDILGSPKSASEFLARADIDGIKYPVDSYGGKTIKDGDKAGWNYVSFRDDNIRVDHKWIDGDMMFSEANPYGVSFEMMNRWRAANGLPPLAGSAPVSDEKVERRADAFLNNEDEVRTLVHAVNRTPRALNDVETVAIGKMMVRDQEAYNRLAEMASRAVEDGNEAYAKALSAQAAAKLDMVEQDMRAMKASGTEQGRAFRLRRILIDRSLSLAGMLGEVQMLNGRRLTQEERDAVKAVYEATRDAVQKLDAARAAELARKIEEAGRSLVDAVLKDDSPASVKADARRAATIERDYRDAMEQAKVWKEKSGGTLVGMPKAQKWVRALVRFHAAAGVGSEMTGVPRYRAVMEAVLADVRTELPNATMDEVEQALSQYGVAFQPSSDLLEKQVRNLQALALKHRQLKDIMEGRVPLKTGYIRDLPTDEQRELDRRKRELMKELGLDMKDQAGRLQTILGSVKRRLRNQIADLEKAIAERRPVAGKKGVVQYDAEAEELKRRRDELKRSHDEMFYDEAAEHEKNVQRLLKTLEARRRDAEERLARARAGDFSKKKRTREDDARVEAARAELDAVNDEIGRLKEEKYPEGTPEEVRARVERRLKALNDSVADINAKIATNDFTNLRERREPVTSPEIREAEKLRNAAYRRWTEMKEKARRANLWYNPKVGENRLLDWTDALMAAPRVMRTMLDLSATLTQGAALFASHPKFGLAALRASIRSFLDERNADWLQSKLDADPDWEEFQRMGGHAYRVSDVGDAVPEEFRGVGTKLKLFGREVSIEDVPGVRASERSYGTFLNCIVLDVYRAMRDGGGWASPSGPTEQQKRDIAEALNVAAGYGYGKGGGRGFWDKVASAAFWAPRFAVAGMKMATGYNVFAPFFRGGADEKTTEERVNSAKQMAKEYARQVTAMAAWTLLATLLLGRKDPEWLEEVLDPRSSNFANVRVGNTNLSFFGPVKQWWTFMARIVTGETRSGGKVRRAQASQTVGRVMRGKLSPQVSTLLDVLEGRDFLGNELDYGRFSPQREGERTVSGVGHVVESLAVPLSGADVVEAFRHNDLARAMLLTPFILAGAGKNTYELDEYGMATNGYRQLRDEERRLLKARDMKGVLELRRRNPVLRSASAIDARLGRVKELEGAARRIEASGKAVPESLKARLRDAREAAARAVREARGA